MKQSYATVQANKPTPRIVDDKVFYYREPHGRELVEFIPIVGYEDIESKRAFAYQNGFTAIGYSRIIGWYCYN